MPSSKLYTSNWPIEAGDNIKESNSIMENKTEWILPQTPVEKKNGFFCLLISQPVKVPTASKNRANSGFYSDQ